MIDIEDIIRRIVREELGRAPAPQTPAPFPTPVYDCPCSPGIICGTTGCRRGMVVPAQPLQPYRVTD